MAHLGALSSYGPCLVGSHWMRDEEGGRSTRIGTSTQTASLATQFYSTRPSDILCGSELALYYLTG